MKIINKIGLDRITHFSMGGLIFAMIYYLVTGTYDYTIGEQWLFLGFFNLFVFVVAVLKELRDSKFDWIDIIFTMLGSLLMSTVTAIGIIV